MKKSKRNYKRNSNRKRKRNKNKNKKGGADGEMCPRHKPICVNKIGKSQNALCGLAEGKFNPMDTLEHAYEIFSTNKAETLNCPKGAKDCFCTHFDYVWLETINYAQNKIKEAIAPQSQIAPKEMKEGLGQIVKALELTPKPDTFFSDFFNKVLDIAEKKWKVNGTLGTNSAYLIEKMTEIKKILEEVIYSPETKQQAFDLVTTATKETANADEATLAAKMEEAQSNPATKEFLNIIQRFFTLGKFVLYDGNQIETLDKTILENDLDALLKELGIGIGEEGENSTAGGSKTLRRKRKNRSKNEKNKRSNKTRKLFKRGGKSVYTPWRVIKFAAMCMCTTLVVLGGVGGFVMLNIALMGAPLAGMIIASIFAAPVLLGPAAAAIEVAKKPIKNYWEKKRAKDSGESTKLPEQ